VKTRENLSNKIKSVRFNESKINKNTIQSYYRGGETMSRKKTHEEYIAELAIKNPDIEVVDKYVNIDTPITHYCKMHQNNFITSPYRALRGVGCQDCYREKTRKLQAKTHNQYVAELSIVNPTLDVLGVYINADTPISHRCKTHNITWDISPANALRGQGCRECWTEKLRSTHVKGRDDYILELANISPHIKLVGEYINAKTATRHYCTLHQVFWDITPSNALKGQGCKECCKHKQSLSLLKTHEQYVLDLASANPYIEVVENYIDAKTPILHRCLVDGFVWPIAPSNALSGKGCPKCNESHGERAVSQWLNARYVKYIPQYTFDNCKDKQLLPFDFYLPKFNIAIEYQGRQHYDPIEFFGGQPYLEYIQRHDRIKSDYCLQNNIQLICVPYWEDINEYLDKFLSI
jgi:hypothetical protein